MMALRNLASKVGGIPALRRASVRRVSPSTRPLTSGSYQGGHKNGAGVGGARKPVKGRRVTLRDLDTLEAQFEASRDAIKKAIRVGKRNERIFIGSGLAAVAIAWVITEPW